MVIPSEGSAPAGSIPQSDGERVLVLNTGSSSVKLALCDGTGRRLWQEQRAWSGDEAAKGPAAGALTRLFDDWLPPLLAGDAALPALVVHRLVHGGERFTEPIPLDAQVMAALEDLVPLAPLHNGPALEAIRWLRQWAARQSLTLPQWACFDTGFHASLAPESYSYALPAAWRQQGLRRFGFHGLNHQHVGETVAAQAPGVRRLVSCHLGAGCSLCAIRIAPDGTPRSVDTTMGFTPLEGLVMATRSGSVDPGLLLHLLRSGVGIGELDATLHRQSGLLGLSGLSGDMRELRSASRSGHGGAQLALAVFRHRLRQGVAAMAASLGGVDGIALSGGIGEHDQALAQELQEELAWLGAVRWLVVPADEEGLMVRLCMESRRTKA
jgi:acetate kinase